MNLAKLSLILTGLVYLIIGIIFLVDPVYWGSSVDISLPTTTAIVDLSATYGGCMFALGVFFFYALKTPALVKTGLILQVICFAGFAFGRTIGMVTQGLPRALMFYLLAAEIAGIVLGVYCLWLISRSEQT